MCIFIHAFVINWAEDAAEQAQSKQAEDILGEESGTPFSIRDKKTSFGERSGADSNNSSSKGLQQGGSERLSSRPHTHQVDAAKVAANTIKTKRSAQKLINAGGFESGLQIGDAIRNVGNVLKLDKSKSSFSYYGDFEGDFDVNGKIIHLRVSSHPANGQRMGDADADIKVSLVIKKGDGEHKDAGEHNGYTEYVYDPSEVSPSDAANAIVKGVLNLIEKGEFVDETGKAKKIDYPYVGEDGETKFRITDEERRIIDKAKADGTYMKAPNGRPTKLNEKQWAQVRTAAFKNWFGDWEKAARVEKLRTSRPVEVVFRNEYELNRESAKQWIKDNLRGEYVNEDTGENISLSKVGANKVTSHGERDEAHLKSIVSIPSLIRSSIFIEELPNEKGNDKYDSYRYYVCGMKIDGEDYTAKIVVGVKGDSKYYDHRLTQIEKGTLIDNLNGLANSVAENQNAPTSVGKDTKLVSLLQTNSSKIVDENGEPMVAYHSGASGITAFSREFDKQGIGRQFWGKGFYFGTEKSKNEWSRRYKGKTGKEAEEYPVFLNIRSPHYGPIKGEITESGYDGSILPPVRTHEGETEPIFIVGGSNQIKSATENVGTFDAGDNDIRFRRTYHGSGNSFERFDHRHMGEGEGAQAYGWGTYVTDVEGIARTYASSSSLFNKVFSDDNDYEAARSVGSVGLAEIAIRSYMEEMNLNFADAKAKALSDAKEIVEEDGELGETTQDKIFKGMIEALPGVTEQMVEDMAKYRHLYEVEIPDNNGMNYLPYDKPISDEMRKYLEDEFDVPGLADAVTGREVYDAFSRHYGGDKVASKMFDIVGIVGVEYPADYRSGGRGEGVNNYVIFNEENAKIVDHTMFRLSKNERAWVRENDVTPDSFRLLADVGIVSRGEAPQWIDPTLKEVYLENKAAFDAMASEVAEEETMFQISSSNKSARRYDKENGTNVEGFFKYLRNGKVAKKGEPDQFHIANAGPILEKYGIKGKFIVGSFTFSRSHTDNEDHKLGVKEWVDVINNLNTPLAITSYKGKPNEYRIYTYATINGKNICVGVNVSTKDGEIYLSNIISAYGRDVEKLLRQEMVYLIYPSEKELKQRILQVSTAHNSLLNASPTASFESKGSAKGSDLQDEANGSSDMNAKNMGESDVLQSSDSKSDEETMMRIKGNGGEEGMYRDEDGNLMFSIRNRATRQVRQIPGGVAVTYYNNELRRGGSSMLEGHYDRYRSLRILQEGVAKETGKKIEDFEQNEDGMRSWGEQHDAWLVRKHDVAEGLQKQFEGAEDAEEEGTLFRFSKTPEEFDAIQKLAKENKGVVMPNLRDRTLNIVDVSKHWFTGNLKNARAEARKWATEEYVGKDFSLPDGEGNYTISSNAIKKYIDNSSIGQSDNPSVHLSVLTSLPRIIEESIDTEIHADYKKIDNSRKAEYGINKKDLLVHRMYGAVDIEGKLYRVKTTMYEFRKGNNSPHNYEVTKIELIEDSTASQTNEFSRPLSASTNSISAAKLLDGVVKSYDGSKKVLDESDNSPLPDNVLQSSGSKSEEETLMRIKGNRGDSAKVLYDKNVLGSAAKGKEAYHDYLRSLRVLHEAILSSVSTIGTDP